MGEIFKRALPKDELPFTGERLTTALIGQTEIEHLHRYFVARQLCRGQDVLDVASGEGYGAALLAQVATSVTGVEIAAEAVEHAKSAYCLPNLRFLQGDARCLPLPDTSVDVVVSFETIEHFDRHDQFLSEIRRVLRLGGRLIVSTPDRDNYSPTGTQANPYHVLELTQDEFKALLSRHFAYVACWAQRPMIGSAMLAALSSTEPTSAPLCFEKRGDHFEASVGLARPQYLVAVASDRPLEALPDSVYIETSLLGAHDQEIRTEAMRAEAQAHQQQLDAARAEAQAHQQQLDAARAEAQAHQQQLDAARAEAQAHQQQLDAARAEAQAHQAAHAEAQQQLEAARALAEKSRVALQTEIRVLEQTNSRAEEAQSLLRQRLEAELAHVVRLQGEITRRDHMAAGHQAEIASGNAEIVALQAEIEGLRAEVAALRTSTSWKVTRPLRLLRGLRTR
jgi:SAM-dependent methyltransferase